MPSNPAVKLLERRLDAMLRALPAAETGDEASVHKARVASRRLREALPVVGASAAAASLGRARRQVRRVTEALGPVRELDVALGHLDEFTRAGAVSPRAAALVRESIAGERQRRRRAMLDRMTPARLDKIQRRFADVSAEAGLAGAARAEADRRVARRAARLGEAMEAAGNMYLPDRLHAVRIAAKKLRYALEIRGELARSRAVARIRRIKALQDRLGRIHDLEILIGQTRIAQASAAAADRRATDELDGLVRALEGECRRLHAEYIAGRRAIDALIRPLARVIEEGLGTE